MALFHPVNHYHRESSLISLVFAWHGTQFIVLMISIPFAMLGTHFAAPGTHLISARHPYSWACHPFCCTHHPLSPLLLHSSPIVTPFAALITHCHPFCCTHHPLSPLLLHSSPIVTPFAALFTHCHLFCCTHHPLSPLLLHSSPIQLRRNGYQVQRTGAVQRKRGRGAKILYFWATIVNSFPNTTPTL